MRKNIAVLGGDLRQIRLAELLAADGWDVVTWGIEKGGAPNTVPLDQAVCRDIIILPLPVLRGKKLNLPLTDTVIEPDELWMRLSSNQVLLGGAIGSLGDKIRAEYGLTVQDYYEREEVQIANAVLTAEGAIMRMMEETEYTVQGSRCLVIGYGRIGKALAQRLQSLGAVVTVSARSGCDLAWIKACGFRASLLKELQGQLAEFDVIFNTAPAQILGAEQLSQVRSDVLLVELASLPGGFDEESVKELNLSIITERGLPGKTAPLSAARTIRDGVIEMLKEQGEEV